MNSAELQFILRMKDEATATLNRVDARTNKLVDDWLAQRAGGAQSSVGDNLNYLNPKYSGRNGRGNGWGGDAFQAEAMRNGYVFGKGNAQHFHGTTAGLQSARPGAFGVNLPGQMGVDPIMTASTGGGQMQSIATQYQQQMTAANQTIAQQMPQMFQQPMANVGQQFTQMFSQTGLLCSRSARSSPVSARRLRRRCPMSAGSARA